MITAPVKRHILMLEKRLRFLSIRVAEGHSKGRDLSWDRAEASALEWALDELKGKTTNQKGKRKNGSSKTDPHPD